MKYRQLYICFAMPEGWDAVKPFFIQYYYCCYRILWLDLLSLVEAVFTYFMIICISPGFKRLHPRLYNAVEEWVQKHHCQHHHYHHLSQRRGNLPAQVNKRRPYRLWKKHYALWHPTPRSFLLSSPAIPPHSSVQSRSKVLLMSPLLRYGDLWEECVPYSRTYII